MASAMMRMTSSWLTASEKTASCAGSSLSEAFFLVLRAGLAEALAVLPEASSTEAASASSAGLLVALRVRVRVLGSAASEASAASASFLEGRPRRRGLGSSSAELASALSSLTAFFLVRVRLGFSAPSSSAPGLSALLAATSSEEAELASLALLRVVLRARVFGAETASGASLPDSWGAEASSCFSSGDSLI